MTDDALLITSAKNPTIKRLRKLAKDSRYRAEQAQSVLDGIHLCQSYLASGQQPQLALVDQTKQQQAEIVELIKSITAASSLVIVPSELFATITPVKQGTGIVFVIDLPHQTAAPTLDHDALLLDRVQDAGNLGTLLRTAAASGLKSVYLSPGCASAWSPQALRAGMGAHFQLNIYSNVDLTQTIQLAKVPVYGTSLSTSRSIYDLDLKQPSAWLFGNEGSGADQRLLELCSQQVLIPQSDQVESLNVAASAAVCLFEQRRQRL